MKNIKKYSALILIFSLLLVSKISLAQEAEGHKYRNIWKKDSLMNSSEELEKFFYLGDKMTISDFSISLKIKASPTLLGDLSSLSILVNRTPVYSIKIKDLDESGLLTLELPEDLIEKGRNSISIQGFLKSSKDRCEFNPDINWLIIEKNSFIDFQVQKKDSEYVRDIFDNTFYSDGLKGHVQVVLPDKLVEENYTQLSSLAGLLGHVHKNRDVDLKINLFKYSDLKEIDKETILLGTAKQIRALDEELLTKEEWKKAEENGFLGLRKIGDKHHFILLASDDEQVQGLLKVLGEKALLDQIKEKNYFIDKDKFIDPSPFKSKASLRDLGYESFSQSGSGVKEFNYFLSLPAKKSLGPNNHFSFDYKYSSLIEENAYVTVEVNGEKLLSKKILTNLDSGKVEFSLPPKFFDQSNFNLSLKFNLAPEEEDCIGESYDKLWIAMEAENSFFDLDLRPRLDYSLLNGQGLLQNENGYLDTSLAIDDYQNISMASLVKLSSYLGKVSQGVTRLSIEKLEKASKENRVLIGLSSSPLLKSEENNFIQKPDQLGLIGLSVNKTKLFITAPNKDQLKMALDKFPTSQGSQTSLRLKDDQVIESFEDQEKNKEEGRRKVSKEILLGLVLLLSFTLLVFLLYFKKIK